MTIMLPEDLGKRLADQAEARRMSVIQLVENLLDESLRETEEQRQAELDLLALVQRIKSQPPPHPSTFHPATASLRNLLADSVSTETPIDSDEWNRQWAQFEAEEKALSRKKQSPVFSN